jgi:adenylate cyclase
MVFTVLLGAVIGLVVSRVDEMPALPIVFGSAVAGLLLGGLMALCEEFLVPRWSRRYSFRRLTLTRVAFHATSMVAVLILVNVVRMMVDLGRSPGEALGYFLQDTGLRDFLIVLVATSLVMLAFQLRRLHSARELWDLISGRYHYPVEESRVVLFADIVGSTGLAERLGPLEYSRFVRDVFADVSEAIVAWGGQVYQYAGDGIVVTWPGSSVRKGGCVRCFNEMSRSLVERAPDYVQRFGAEPRMRGGIHHGPVVATRVGETRSEMALHGDTLNVAARLQSLCASKETPLLVSADTHAAIENAGELGLVPLGDVELRGRSRPMPVYAVPS